MTDRPTRAHGTEHTPSAENVVIMGLGSFGGGLGAARYLARRGARVTVTDLRGAEELASPVGALTALVAEEGLSVRTVLGEHRAEDFDRADRVVANPAVRPDHPLLARARERGARITTEIELLLEELFSKRRSGTVALPRVVCVTGTHGKSSTCHILHSLVTGCGRRSHLGGNIGGSLLEKLDTIESGDVVVLELSSYQLEALGSAADIRLVEGVAVTNVHADHLERHGGLEGYAAAKRMIVELVREDGFVLLPGRDAHAASWTTPRGRCIRFGTHDRTPRDELAVEDGAFLLDGEELGRVSDLHLSGEFQRTNALVALGMARLLGVPARELAAALPRVRGLSHRLEPLGWFGGRRVHDNAVSTTPASTVAALRALPTGSHVILGGRLKALPLDELVRVASDRVERAICFGEAGDELASALERAGVRVARTADVETAVLDALAHAPPGSDVLFSPACASFDAYPNFRARAMAFRAALPPADPE